MNAQTAILRRDITPEGADYETVRRVIEKISLDYRDQPSLETLAAEVGETPTSLQKLFTRWAGLSPKAFLQAVTLDHARRLLDEGMPLLETAYELGMSGPGRLHDLFVTHEAMSPGDYKTRGAGLTIRYGFHISPFGVALIMVTERGLAGLAFNDAGGERAAFEDMSARWPNATYVEDMAATAPYAARIFDRARWRSDGYRCASGKPRGGCGGRRQPNLFRGSVPQGPRQIRRLDRLSLGADPEAGHPRLGSRADEGCGVGSG